MSCQNLFMFFIYLLSYILSFLNSANGESCNYKKQICDIRKAVFMISAFDPLASAVRITATHLVTTRHSVADETRVKLLTKNGSTFFADVLPTNLTGDLILLEAKNLPNTPIAQIANIQVNDVLRTVAIDLGKRRVKIYPPGTVTFVPLLGQPKARIHHTAYSQPGNSGGALINSQGSLVGIVASGGEGRFEAIPTSEILRLKKQSGIIFSNINKKVGTAIRRCILKLESIQQQPPRFLKNTEASNLAKTCLESTNRQLYDMAASVIGRYGHLQKSIALFKDALKEDLQAVNSRIGLLISLSMSMKYKETLPHIHWLLQRNINDTQILRFGIQSGVWGADKNLVNIAISRLRKVNPKMVATAQKFIDNPPPLPKRKTN